MTAPVANSLGMAVPYGAIFDRPEAGSPAAKAGIEAGDVIITINGSPLGSPRDFATTIAAMAPGTNIYLRTYRNRQPMSISLILGRGKCPQVHECRIMFALHGGTIISPDDAEVAGILSGSDHQSSLNR